MHWRTLLVVAIVALSVPGVSAQESIVTNIAFVRAQLHPETLAPTNQTQLFEVEGIVTTWVNLTTANHGLFYLQDDTAGIAVFHSGASNSVPPAGARVRVKAPITHFNGLLELAPIATNPVHVVTTLSTNHPLPVPRRLSLAEMAALSAPELDAVEGSLITLTNITLLDLTNPAFRAGSTERITDASGLAFDLRIDARTDLVGQAKPTGEFAVIGVLGQFDTSNPWTAVYQVIPSRFADLFTPSKAPTVRWTNVLTQLLRPGDLPVNTFSEIALQPGERLEVQVELSDPESRTYAVDLTEPTGGWPSGSGWLQPSSGNLTGTNIAIFVFQPTVAESGRLYLPSLVAKNEVGTNTMTWRIYVPTTEEQRVVLMEFFANPGTDTNSPAYNPLRRDPVSENPSQHDEFLELVNFNPAPIDLQGWRVWDGTALRHVFYAPTPVASSNAFILYGGPLNGLDPNLDVPVEPASESSAGLALNNNGDTIAIYNAATNLILRTVYPANLVADAASVTRFPNLNGAFAVHTEVSTNAVSPGRQADGRSFSEPPPETSDDIYATAALAAGGALKLSWNAVVGRVYSVLATDTLGNPFGPLATGLTFNETQGAYTDASVSARTSRFYQIRSP